MEGATAPASATFVAPASVIELATGVNTGIETGASSAGAESGVNRCVVRPASGDPRTGKRKKKKAKQKHAEGATMGAGGCHFWIPRKSRFCKFEADLRADQPLATGRYCRLHLVEEKDRKDTAGMVPCPLDGSHCVAAHRLDRHLKICPVVRDRTKLETEPFFSVGCNAGHNRYPRCPAPSPSSAVDDPAAEAEALLHDPVRFRVFLDDLSAAYGELGESQATAAAVADADDAEHNFQLELGFEQLRPDACLPLFGDSHGKFETDSANPKSRYRHSVQQASIIGHMQRVGICPLDRPPNPGGPTSGPAIQDQPHAVHDGAAAAAASDAVPAASNGAARASNSAATVSNGAARVYVELGSGRGALSVALGKTADKSANIVMVERASCKHKGDKYLRGDPAFVGQVWRAKCDLQHYAMAKDPAVQELGDARDGGGVVVIGMAKHLCGAGTDLGLRALDNYRKDPDGNVAGIAIATCCHHRCEWQHLCIDAGDVPGWRFGPEGGRFVALTRISQWANCRNTFKANPKPRTGGQSAAGPELAGDEAAYTGPATIPDSPPLGNRDGTRSAAPEAAVGNGAAVDWDDDGHAVDADTRSLTARLDLPITTLQKYGRMAKLLIDHHRARWIQAEFGMACDVVHFADPATTLENTLILAYPKP